jgi:hypothetical protein
VIGVLAFEQQKLIGYGRWPGSLRDVLRASNVMTKSRGRKGRTEVLRGNCPSDDLSVPRRGRVTNLSDLIAVCAFDNPGRWEALEAEHLWRRERSIVPVEGTCRRSWLRRERP